MQGSKYVQSIMRRELDKSISADLRHGQVLFVGTPCQVMSVRNRLRDAAGMTCVDLVCHGVPSPDLLDEQLRDLTSGRRVNDVSFRDKLAFRLQLRGDDFCIAKEWLDVPYYALYMHFADLREGCYSCPFARLERVGDITLGDYVEDGSGYSCVLVNSDRGSAVIGELGSRIRAELRPLENLSENSALYRPTPKHKSTERFTMLYERYGLRSAYYLSFPLFVTKRFVNKLLGDKAYGLIKRYVGLRDHT
jgi:coenzyme F420-reducing hydrogenase beta subunit